MGKYILLTECNDLPKGKLIETTEKLQGKYIAYKEGDKTYYIPKKNVINLQEALTTQDQEKVREIVREILVRYFWRQYTRSSFLLK